MASNRSDNKMFNQTFIKKMNVAGKFIPDKLARVYVTQEERGKAKWQFPYAHLRWFSSELFFTAGI